MADASPLDDLRASMDRLKGFTAAPTTPQVNPPHTLIGGPENMKTLFDGTMLRVLADAPVRNLWETLQFSVAATHAGNLAAISNRVNNQAADYDFAVKMGSVLAAQAGVTETQAQVSPIRTGAADTQTQQPAGAVYPPIRNVDQSGSTATGTVQAAIAGIANQVSALQDVVTKLADAMVPIIAKNANPAPTA